MTTSRIDTKRSASFRHLRLESLDDLLGEVDRIEAAALEGSLVANGNWTAGQILSHLAAWIEYAYVGFPIKAPPFFIRWALRLQLKKMLDGAMPRGVKIPSVKGGTTGADDAPVQEAAARYRRAIARLKTDEPAPYASPAFGELDDEQRRKLQLRHAELHLGYLSY